MSTVRTKKLWAAAMIITVGTLFGAFPGGCATYLSEQALSAFDFCSVLNCTSGTYFNFCEGPSATLLDCPNATDTQR